MKRRLRTIVFLWFTLLIGAAVAVAAHGSPPQASPHTLGEAAGGRPIGKENTSRRSGSSPFFNKKLTEAQKKLLTPSAEDQATYRDFLRQEHTGLVRLLPRGLYEFSATVDANRDPEMVLPILGGGAFYSFTEQTHNLGPWSEISLQDGKLIVGFAAQSLGLMLRLGDVPLDSVSPATAGVDYLVRYVPPTALGEATEQRSRNFQGFQVDSRSYQSLLPAAINQTYVARSVIYKKEGRLYGRVYVPHPYEYEGADVLLAFRVVRVSDDGSLTILWKRLQKFSPPKIKDVK
jgi:hypothetical protein